MSVFVDERCLAALRGFGGRVVQRCIDQDLDAPTVLERCEYVRREVESAGIGRGDVVAIKGRRDSWLLPVLLGILRSGAAYTVIPFNSPVHVENTVLRTIRPRAVIAWDDLAPAAWLGRPRLALSERLHLLVDRSARPATERGPRSADEVCYVCTTSGTTGTPKCVAVPHRAVAAFLDAARAVVDLAPTDIVAARSSAAFDLSVWELFGSLTAGATSVLVVESVAADVSRLHAVLAGEGCTVLSTTPSAAYQLGSHDKAVGGGLALRRLLVGGEAADGLRLADVLAAPSFAGCRLDNWYGPTEATVSCTGGRLDDERLRKIELTIGPPLPGVRACVLGEDGEDHRIESDGRSVGPGELAVAGDQLALGYLGNPRATAAAFVPDPDAHGGRRYRTGDRVTADGSGWVTYLGRLDNQVQLRGYRLELTEVERAIAAHENVRWCHATVGGTDGDVLIAYFARRDHAVGLDRSALWRTLHSRLPRHAVPAALVEIEDIPISVGEKLARDRLPPPSAADFAVGDSAVVPPQSPTEQRLLELWRRLLGVDDIGTTHHFFALGGHSLLVARLSSGIRRTFGVQLQLADVMERLTIRELAVLVDAELARSRRSDVSAGEEFNRVRKEIV
ncbi:non-ribosomal peptide synthetase [Nocardia sp. CDC159]|uniref:Non-ribosomal peptide synthetase n=1 Tax=Nocardia pulmonis TaxID=2951408 RepID=A0A9X2J1S6_9NOCA|nr:MULTISPECIES: non-ribosomal peptide synthetase [Nocardia]MCM6778420.1 non-ribosomal peptide synthetase [Nocardia pulmonis]MCM6791309.1 non-ribosomal peptide synthetase [Nocardia sp. CDC159]